MAFAPDSGAPPSPPTSPLRSTVVRVLRGSVLRCIRHRHSFLERVATQGQLPDSNRRFRTSDTKGAPYKRDSRRHSKTVRVLPALPLPDRFDANRARPGPRRPAWAKPFTIRACSHSLKPVCLPCGWHPPAHVPVCAGRRGGGPSRSPCNPRSPAGAASSTYPRGSARSAGSCAVRICSQSAPRAVRFAHPGRSDGAGCVSRHPAFSMPVGTGLDRSRQSARGRPAAPPRMDVTVRCRPTVAGPRLRCRSRLRGRSLRREHQPEQDRLRKTCPILTLTRG